MRIGIRLIWGVLAFALAHSALGGSLAERNKRVAERSEQKKEEKKDNDSSGGHHDGSRTSFGSGTYPSSSSGSGGFLSDVWSWMILAPFAYRHDDPSASMDSDGDDWAEASTAIFPRHETGQATVPYGRIDYNRQWAEDTDVDDGRVEIGYKLIAFHGRMSRYENIDGTDLDVRQYYFVLRYGGYRPDFIPGTFEFSAGLGLVHHSGSSLSGTGLEDDSSGAIIFPVKYYPFDWFGIEFRPAWYRLGEISQGDYDFSVSTGYRYLQFRGGYRWIWENGYGIVDELSGPYAGLSVSF